MWRQILAEDLWNIIVVIIEYYKDSVEYLYLHGLWISSCYY